MFLRIYLAASLSFILVSSFKDLHFNVGCMEYRNSGGLLMKSDLTKYLEALHRLITFSVDHKNDIDISYYFGLFLADVNLKQALVEQHRPVPSMLRESIKKATSEIGYLLEYFKYAIKEKTGLFENKYKTIFSLFVNGTTWINSLPKLSITCWNEALPIFNFEKVITKWSFYKESIDDRRMWMPNPTQSDLCLASLASAEVIIEGTSRKCIVFKFCIEMLKNGTDFGYALTHRLLFLQQAAFARNCSILSDQEDKKLREQFCTLAYREAEYIVLHNFEIVDLLLEQVLLCALDGHGVFLKRSWLENILKFQTVDGCFSSTFNRNRKSLPILSQRSTWKVRGISGRPIGYCNRHTSALAAGTLAMATRFILKYYY